MQVTIVGGGMIVHDQILPSFYQLQRLGLVDQIAVCAQHGRTLEALAGSKLIRDAFPGHKFRAYPDAAGDLNQPHPHLYREAIAAMPPRNVVMITFVERFGATQMSLQFKTVKKSESKSFLDDLEEAVARGTPESRARALWHTTDLMIAGRFSDDEIWTFGEVVTRLADEIEVAARAQLSERLARFRPGPRQHHSQTGLR